MTCAGQLNLRPSATIIFSQRKRPLYPLSPALRGLWGCSYAPGSVAFKDELNIISLALDHAMPDAPFRQS